MLPTDSTPSNLSLVLTFPQTQQQIRVVGFVDAPEWVAADVCEVLGISNYRDAVAKLDPDERGVVIADTLGGRQQMLTVTEPGLYQLVMVSRKPAAKTFKRWICHEVLPSLRLHGCYPAPAVPRNPASLMLRQLADSLERQDRLEAEQQDMAQRLEYVADKVKDLDGDTGYVTVLAYARLRGMDMPRSEAQRHGKALARIHRARDVRVGKVPDERHGQVNAYRIDLVEAYFADQESRL